jgi:predicted DNA-binding transcriptional regulator AlpA
MPKMTDDRRADDAVSSPWDTVAVRGRRTASRKTDSPPEFWTVDQFCALIDISRSTFYDWRAKGKAPDCIVLPNGSLRIQREDLSRWLSSRRAA